MNIIQQKIQTFRFTDRIIDMLLLFCSARLAIIVERVMHQKSWNSLDVTSFNFLAILIIFLVWLILISLLESELIYRQTPFWNIFKNIALISFIGVTSTITLDFLLKSYFFKRSTIVFFGVISFSFLLCKRILLKYFLSSIRQEGFDPKNILIVGSHRRAERIVHQFSKHKEYGFRIRAILDPDTSRLGALVDSIKVSGDLSNIKTEIKNNEIDEVFFAIDLNLIFDIHSIFTYLDTIGVSYHMMLNESVHTYTDKYLGIEPVSTNYYGMPMLSFDSVSASHFKLYIKNTIEKVIALLLIIFTFPILIFFGLLIKLSSKGPIFF